MGPLITNQKPEGVWGREYKREERRVAGATLQTDVSGKRVPQEQILMRFL
jgi:hypothetical protein